MTTCAVCQTPLTLEIERDEDDKDQTTCIAEPSSLQRHHTVPDDVELACGCHFHWYVHGMCDLLFNIWPCMHESTFYDTFLMGINAELQRTQAMPHRRLPIP